MTFAPRVQADPFICPAQIIDGKPSVHDQLRAGGRLVEAQAPAGGPAWVVTDDSLARAVLADPRFVKDPELAPVSWRGVEDGLDLPIPELRKFTIISVDGEAHRRLRRIHAPAFNPRRLAAKTDRITTLAHSLLSELADASDAADEPAELVHGFGFHFPLLVICELLGVPVTDPVTARAAISAMKAIALGTADGQEDSFTVLSELIDQAIAEAKEGADTMTRILYERSGDEFGSISDDQLQHMIIGLIFAGHDTTGSFLGFLLAEVLAGHLSQGADEATVSAFVDEALRYHPPVPYTLWRFAAEEVSLDGIQLPVGAPVLIDIEGINTDAAIHDQPHKLCPARSTNQRLTFGDGPHYCLGQQLAQLESVVMISVLRDCFPHARLAVSLSELRWSRVGSQTARLHQLPAWLR